MFAPWLELEGCGPGIVWMLAYLLFGDGEQGTAFPYSRSLLGAVSGLAIAESLPCSGDPSWAPGVGGEQREGLVLSFLDSAGR